MRAARRSTATSMVAVLLVTLSLLAGCASLPGARATGDAGSTPAGTATVPTAAPAEPIVPAGPLEQVPFHPQALHQCGPAALAMLLGASGIAADPLALADQVYVPGRRGSFQAELVAATRSAGRIPWRIDGTLAAVAQELAAGRPVLVLQNLGIPAWPRWHYAVIVGVDQDRVTLRSGRQRALRTSHRAFLRSWGWADHWGMVALQPGEWPARPEPQRWLATMSDLERVGRTSLAATGLEAAVDRWPGEPLAWFAAGNSRYRAGERVAARNAWRQATRLQPDFGAAWNNLAHVDGELGCLDEARTALARGMAVSADAVQRQALERTGRDLASRPQPASSTASACSSDSGRP